MNIETHKTKSINFSVICCYYNELNILKKEFDKFDKFSSELNFEHEFIFVDNNSTDGSKEFLKNEERKKNKNFFFIFNKKNIGKGGSIKNALSITNKKYAIVFDIDEYELLDLKKVYNIIKDEDHDFLVGSRILKNQKNFIYKKNYYGVKLITAIINYLFNIKLTDSAGATKMIKLSEYKKYTFKTNKFDFEFDVLCKFAKDNKKISEFYSKYNPRTYSEGKKLRAFRDGFTILITILRNFFGNNEK